jgi:phosphatidylglycerol:prolipoprotein diacylglycerol transferase
MIFASFSYRPVQRWGPVSPHGVGTAVGFLAGAMLMARRAEPRGIPRAEVYNAVTWGAVGALIGARGFYVIGHIHQFTSLKDVVAVWQGGLTMFGGFVGGLVLGLWYLHRKGFAIPPALDAAAPGFALGVLIGRIGDIIIADHLGRPTHFFLGYKIPAGAKLAPGYGPPIYVPGAVVHHTALYDFAGTIVLFLFLFWVERRRPPVGSLFATFAVWYGMQRFFIDFTRNRTLIESHFFGLSGSQWAGLAFALAGAIWLVRLRGRARTPVPAAEPVPVSAAPAPETTLSYAPPVAGEPAPAPPAYAPPTISETPAHEPSSDVPPPPLPTREESFAAQPEPAPVASMPEEPAEAVRIFADEPEPKPQPDSSVGGPKPQEPPTAETEPHEVSAEPPPSVTPEESVPEPQGESRPARDEEPPSST